MPGPGSSTMQADAVLSTPALHGQQMKFRARLYRNEPWTVALLTDLDDQNPGCSITNGIEYAVAAVLDRWPEINPARLVVVEHYDDREPIRQITARYGRARRSLANRPRRRRILRPGHLRSRLGSGPETPAQSRSDCDRTRLEADFQKRSRAVAGRGAPMTESHPVPRPAPAGDPQPHRRFLVQPFAARIDRLLSRPTERRPC
jgi:hypothetical protein